jgi:hypothetical protein
MQPDHYRCRPHTVPRLEPWSPSIPNTAQPAVPSPHAPHVPGCPLYAFLSRSLCLAITVRVSGTTSGSRPSEWTKGRMERVMPYSAAHGLSCTVLTAKPSVRNSEGQCGCGGKEHSTVQDPCVSQSLCAQGTLQVPSSVWADHIDRGDRKRRDIVFTIEYRLTHKRDGSQRELLSRTHITVRITSIPTKPTSFGHDKSSHRSHNPAGISQSSAIVTCRA